MYLNLISPRSQTESMHSIASNYGRSRNLIHASDAPLPTTSSGMVNLGFAFQVATPYKKYKKNNACVSRGSV